MNATVLASIMQGEAGVLGLPGMFAIGICAMSRMATHKSWHGFYGRAKPSPQAYLLARVFMSIPSDIWTGLYGTYPYCLSRQDIERLGFPKGDKIVGNGKYQIHLYRRWPRGEKE